MHRIPHPSRPGPARPIRSTTAFACLVLGLSGCEEVERLVDDRRDLTPHEAYAASLEDAGLAGAALGRGWLEAAAEAVESPVHVTLPFREQGWLPPEHPMAVGYRMTLERGRVLSVRVELDGVTTGASEPDTDSVTAANRADSTRLFVDLFRVPEDPADPLRPVAATDSAGPGDFTYEPWREGEYVLRVQPELLRGGPYRVTLSLDPALAFPVEGRGVAAIQSFFGAERDGGARNHHGLDIFAPRGTPVLAAADGRVSRANETPRGGRVVWIRDDRRPQSLYYAHLDSQTVERGQSVRTGDTVGFVGNTGNARTTPPHLHFGIYQRGRGPVDPLAWVRPVRRELPPLPGDATRLGSWARTTTDGSPLRVGPEEGATVREALSRGAYVRLLGGTGAWWRVRLPDGRVGYLSVSLAETLAETVAVRDAGVGTPEESVATGSLRPGPRPGSPPAPLP